jgi:GMP synthase-like glutamine amidotransferase
LDNSPRRLGTAWFGKWFKQFGCKASAFHAWRGSLPSSLDRFDAVIVSGSPASATQDDPWVLSELKVIEQADHRGLPVMGVCFGSQLLARAFYGKSAVRLSSQAEFGWSNVTRERDDPLFRGVPRQFTSFQYHAEEVLPQPDMHVLASSPASAVQAFRVGRKPIWGIQFHLEVTPRAGRDLLRKTERVYAPYGLRFDDLAAEAQPCQATEKVFGNFLEMRRG